MANTWPGVPLGKAMNPVHRAEAPFPGRLYRQVGVRLWGEGTYEREPVDGALTRYGTLFRVEAGDIIVNKIWARNGSVAVVSTDLAGGYVSSEFPTFVPIPGKLDPRWFHWITKTMQFWAQCDDKSRGTSSKNRIKPEAFLAIEIALPALSEQRRIVGRIEELAAKIEEARGARRQALQEPEAVLAAAISKVFSQAGTANPRSLSSLPSIFPGMTLLCKALA